MNAGQVITDLNAWTTGVLFPLAVIVLAGAAGYIARCTMRILQEFQQMRRTVDRMAHALVKAGILDPE